MSSTSNIPEPPFEKSIDKPSVVCRNVTKLYNAKSASVTQRKAEKVRALHNASLVARKGDSIGLLGQNGSGKSTMLRLIAGAEAPTSGEIKVSAKPTILGVSAALVPYLSGRRNVYLGCMAMGMTPSQVDAVYDEIVQFADIGDAIERPMNTYSSGMAARLKFAIGTAAVPEILLVDEALSTGDSAFKGRADERMKKLLDGAGTLFLVSHEVKAVENVCSRAIWIHDGEIIADTEAWIACEQYTKWTVHLSKGRYERAEEFINEVRDWYSPTRIVFDSEIF